MAKSETVKKDVKKKPQKTAKEKRLASRKRKEANRQRKIIRV